MFAFLDDIFQYKWHFMIGEANSEQSKKKKKELGFTYIFAYLITELQKHH